MNDGQAGSPHVGWVPGLAALPPVGEGMTRKGDAARKALDSASPDWDLVVAMDRLAWLAGKGMLAGVDEIMRERLRQEALGYTVSHDDEQHADAWLVTEAFRRVRVMVHDVAEGIATYPEAEKALREAGALLAAEIDRLNRMLESLRLRSSRVSSR